MQPQYSPDGRFWWDGRQWQPVQDNGPTPPQPAPPPNQAAAYGQAPPPGPPLPPYGQAPPPGPPLPPYGQTPPPHQQPPHQPQPSGPPPHWQGGPAPARQRSKAPFIIGAVILALVLLVGSSVYLVSRTNSQAGPERDGAGGPAQPPSSGIEPGDKITDEKLRSVNASAFYFEMLHRQMTQPINEITSAYFQRPADFQRHDRYFLNRVGVDHRSGDDVATKKFTFESASIDDGSADDRTRCINKKYYYQSEDIDTGKPKWSHLSDSDQDCRTLAGRAQGHDGDQIVTSGLTSEQADKVVGSLRDEYKFGEPRHPELITGDNHETYIRQIVEYKPKKLADGSYYGNWIFTWAFKKSGLDPQTYPWPGGGFGAGEGLHVVYYIDTESLLPLVGVQRSTPVLDDNGKPAEHYDQTMVINYAFPDRLRHVTLKDMKPPTLILPEGWTIPK